MEPNEFHWNHLVTFKRIGSFDADDPWGTVRIRKYRDNAMTEVEWELKIPPNEWCSCVASVCSQGETGYTFHLASAFHEVPSA